MIALRLMLKGYWWEGHCSVTGGELLSAAAAAAA
jgi:hypothetical protein